MERTGIHELSAPYALDALEPAERSEFEEHLTHCEDCRDTVVAFQETAASLAYEAEMPPPPPALRRRILDEASRDRSNVVSLRPRWAFPAAASAAAAACAAIGLGIWAAILHNRLGDRPEAIGLNDANGSLIVSPSHEGTLVVGHLDPVPAGKTYEIWVIQAGKPLAAGTFPGGDRVAVVLTRKVPDNAVVAVTLERAGGVDAPTTTPLLTSKPV